MLNCDYDLSGSDNQLILCNFQPNSCLEIYVLTGLRVGVQSRRFWDGRISYRVRLKVARAICPVRRAEMKTAILTMLSGLQRKAQSIGRGLAALCALALFGLSAAWTQENEATATLATSTLTTFEVPGAGTGPMQGTIASSIDTAGDIAGTYLDSNGIAHGFVRTANGTIKTYTAPLAGVAGKGSTKDGKGTFFTSMDASGDIAGYYSDTNNLYHGLFLPAKGSMTTFDAPGATAWGHLGTSASSINTAGVITGIYRDANLVHHGFIRAANDKFVQVDASGAGAGMYQGTEPTCINAAGTIAGIYVDADGASHGFVLLAGGTKPTDFDVPGAVATTPTSINTAGDIAGTYTDQKNLEHGFLRSANGAITTFDPPVAQKSPCPKHEICGGVAGINAEETITGFYQNADGVLLGFLRNVNGTMTSFDAPGAGTSGSIVGTGGLAINAVGVIAGTYSDNNSVLHGFLFNPAGLIATSTTLASAPPALVYAEPVTFTAKIASGAGGAPPSEGNVSFYSGTTLLGTTALSGGTATFTTTALPVGTDSITATYSGDAIFAGSRSKAVSEVVGKASSTVALISKPNPSSLGQLVTFTASVAGQFGGTPTGTVTLNNGKTALKTVALGKAAASFSISNLATGEDTMTAVYSGDGKFAGSTSKALVQQVGPAAAQAFRYAVLYEFTGSPDGSNPGGGVLDAEGNLYGITAYGGDSKCNSPYGCGTVVKLNPAGKETVLHKFTASDGAVPFGGVVLDGVGNLYGTTNYGGDLACNPPDGCGTIFKLNLTTGTLTVLHSFTGKPDATEPESPLLMDAQGNLYGSSETGGAFGNGAVFKVTPAGKESVVYSYPAAGGEFGKVTALDALGNLYGTTRGGGADSDGTVFKLDGTGKLTVLHSFTGTADGSSPRELILDAAGNLLGETKAGGTYGDGAIYKLDSTGKFTVLYSFTGGTDGNWPSGLNEDAQGNVYGTAQEGGNLACNAPTGCGTAYKLDTTGKLTVLHAFTGTETDGATPSGVLRDVQGNLYGDTAGGGVSTCSVPGKKGALVSGCGTVFKLALAGATTTSITLASSQNPSSFDQSVTFTATVASSEGAPANGNSVWFMNGTTALGAAALSGGTAKFTTTSLPLGSNAITAVYAGDSNFAGSASKAISQTVGKAATTTTLASSANPSTVGQSVTFTATVSGKFGGTPTGTVTFNDAATALKAVSLSAGVAKFTTTALTAGAHSITAVYGSGTDFAGSSRSLTQTVK